MKIGNIHELYLNFCYCIFFQISVCKYVTTHHFRRFFFQNPIWRLGFCSRWFLTTSVFSVGSGAEAAGFSNGLATAPIASGPDIPTLVRGSSRRGEERWVGQRMKGWDKGWVFFFCGGWWLTVKGWEPLSRFFFFSVFHVFFWRDGKRFKLVYQGRCK